MKKSVSVILIILILVSLIGCNNKNRTTAAAQYEKETSISNELKENDEFLLIEENESLAFFIKGKTSEFSIKNKKSGETWYSNPVDIEDDQIAQGTNKTNLYSQISVSYFDRTDKFGTMDNYNDSIVLGQFTYAKIDNGIRVTYDIGEKKQIKLVPTVISKERFEKIILDKLDDNDKNALLERYQIETLDGVSGELYDSLLEQYPALKNSDVYAISGRMPDFILEELEDIIKKTDYSIDDLSKDNRENNIPLPKEPDSFTVAVEYTLESDSFSAKIPVENIETTGEVILTDIDFLPYFGAANSSKNGYIFVPDGSGAIINYNNKKTQHDAYHRRVYGKTDNIAIENTQRLCMPVFGMVTGSEALLGIIETADAASSLTADISGRNNSYNYVYSSYDIRDFDIASLSFNKEKGINVYSENLLSDDISVKYFFLSNDDANYSGMARKYRDYLDLPSRETNSAKPLYITMAGAIETQSSFLGMPIKTARPLSTFNETEDLLKQLKNKGIDEIVLSYDYFLKGGNKNSIPYKLNVENNLGGIKALNKLIDYGKKNMVEIYPNVDFQYTGKSIPEKTGAKTVFGDMRYDYAYSIASNTETSNVKRNIISPVRYNDIISKYISSMKNLNTQNTGVSKLASDINMDYDKNNGADMQAARKNIESALNKLAQGNMKISSDGANAYAVKYLNDIFSSPMTSDNYYLFDESVPFYQMVVSGACGYGTYPLNRSGDIAFDLLKAVETGASPHFYWSYRQNIEVKDTDYQGIALYYSPWVSEAVDSYKKANRVFTATNGSKIKSHKKTAEGVYVTSYENGANVYVNYNNNNVTVNGNDILPMSFSITTEVDNLEQ